MEQGRNWNASVCLFTSLQVLSLNTATTRGSQGCGLQQRNLGGPLQSITQYALAALIFRGEVIQLYLMEQRRRNVSPFPFWSINPSARDCPCQCPICWQGIIIDRQRSHGEDGKATGAWTPDKGGAGPTLDYTREKKQYNQDVFVIESMRNHVQFLQPT